MMKPDKEAKDDDLENSDREQKSVALEVFEEEEIQEPYNPKDISLRVKVVPMGSLLERLKRDKEINLDPYFQRNSGIWNRVTKSRLIESLILKIPLPLFYVAETEAGDWEVVDGLQRISTLQEFCLKESWKLKDLEYFKDLNGKKYSDLPRKVQRIINETEFQFCIIEPRTPEPVKLDIFKRINTGGKPLNQQEIRQALYHGPATDLLKDLQELESFRKATGEMKNDRMQAEELILRGLSFVVRSYKHYTKESLNGFLIDTLLIINKENSRGAEQTKFSRFTLIHPSTDFLRTRKEDIITSFDTSMQRAFKFFKDAAFRQKTRQTKGRINKALFEVWTVILAELSEEQWQKFYRNRNLFRKEYKKTLSNSEFKKALIFTSSITSVKARFSLISKLVDSFLGG